MVAAFGGNKQGARGKPACCTFRLDLLHMDCHVFALSLNVMASTCKRLRAASLCVREVPEHERGALGHVRRGEAKVGGSRGAPRLGASLTGILKDVDSAAAVGASCAAAVLLRDPQANWVLRNPAEHRDVGDMVRNEFHRSVHPEGILTCSSKFGMVRRP